MAKKIAHVFFNTILWILIVFFIGMLVLQAAGIDRRIVLSGSMEPAIHTGALAFVNTNVDYGDIEEGDVVAFESETGQMVTHRVITVTDGGLETKGDNNDVSDGITTTAENYYGKTIFSIPYLGYALDKVQGRQGLAFAIAVFAGLFLLAYLTGDGEKGKEKRPVRN